MFSELSQASTTKRLDRVSGSFSVHRTLGIYAVLSWKSDIDRYEDLYGF